MVLIFCWGFFLLLHLVLCLPYFNEWQFAMIDKRDAFHFRKALCNVLRKYLYEIPSLGWLDSTNDGKMRQFVHFRTGFFCPHFSGALKLWANWWCNCRKAKLNSKLIVKNLSLGYMCAVCSMCGCIQLKQFSFVVWARVILTIEFKQ